jgi:signal peptidase II
LSVGNSYIFLKHFVYLTLVKNKGAAFGIFPSFSSVFIIATFLFILIILLNYKKIKMLNSFIKYGVVLQFAGAGSNLIDRVRFGYVIDFIDLRFWPVFNLADISITIGAFLLIIGIFRKKL